MSRKGVNRKGLDSSFEPGGSRTKRARRDERQQEASKEDDFYNPDVAGAAQVQEAAPVQQESPQIEAGTLSNARNMFEQLLGQLQQQTTLEEACLSNIQETLEKNVGEAVEEFLLTAKKYLENKRKAVFGLVSDINGALQRIAEVEKKREDVKETMAEAWNTLG